MSELIIEISNFDEILRFASISDLIAAEGKYHLSCFSASKRSRDKTKSEMKDNDLALVWLSKELEYAADKGHVIRLDDAWERYTILAEKRATRFLLLLSVEGRLLRTNLCIWLETS
ncbi:Hypothetical predicted protein [Paramuricea clavata]|uniref:Uncharacterized protein n=1 Tax=Paramuricea clavata TaxID=317549 RepID=A0A7D9HPL0_PARCT|nr:Hypothetical predicted protein [Paramuricea clavata]